MGLENMQDPRYLDLAFSQVQGNVGLENMSDSKHLDLAVSQVHYTWTLQSAKSNISWVWQTCHTQSTWTWQLGKSKVTTILHWAPPMEWGNVGLVNMSNPRHVDLAVSHVQDNMNLTNMPDLKYFLLTLPFNFMSFKARNPLLFIGVRRGIFYLYRGSILALD
jgi:hypothetical protein